MDAGVRFASGIVRAVRMLMITIVLMTVLMGHRLVDVVVNVLFDQVMV